MSDIFEKKEGEEPKKPTNEDMVEKLVKTIGDKSYLPVLHAVKAKDGKPYLQIVFSRDKQKPVDVLSFLIPLR